MGRIILVTGTDTGVGKTIVAAWLAWLTSRSQRVALVKAVQTGADPAVDGDDAFYRAALTDHPVTIRTLATFPEPHRLRRGGQVGEFKRKTSSGLVWRSPEITT
jgi:dethiobiotin synthetase